MEVRTIAIASLIPLVLMIGTGGTVWLLMWAQWKLSQMEALHNGV